MLSKSSPQELLKHLSDVKRRLDSRPGPKKSWTRALVVVVGAISFVAQIGLDLPDIIKWYFSYREKHSLNVPDPDYRARGRDLIVEDLDFDRDLSKLLLVELVELLDRPELAQDAAFRSKLAMLRADEKGCSDRMESIFLTIEGRWELAMGRPSQAIPLFEKALVKDPKNFVAKICLLRGLDKEIQRLKDGLGGLNTDDQLLLKRYHDLSKTVATDLEPCRISEGTNSRSAVARPVGRAALPSLIEPGFRNRYSASPEAGTGRSRFVTIALNTDRPEHIVAAQAPLVFAENDANAVASSLRRLGFEGEVILGDQATPERIFAALAREVLASSRDNDQLIVYFAGHGWVDGDGHQVVSAWSDNPTEDSGLVLMDDLRAILELHPGNVTVIADSCLRPIEKTLTHITNPVGRKLKSEVSFIYATQPGAESFESRMFGGGVFTKSLLDYLALANTPTFDLAKACTPITARTSQAAKLAVGVDQVPYCTVASSLN